MKREHRRSKIMCPNYELSLLYLLYELVSRMPPNTAVKAIDKLSMQGASNCFLALIFTLYLASNTYTMG